MFCYVCRPNATSTSCQRCQMGRFPAIFGKSGRFEKPLAGRPKQSRPWPKVAESENKRKLGIFGLKNQFMIARTSLDQPLMTSKWFFGLRNRLYRPLRTSLNAPKPRKIFWPIFFLKWPILKAQMADCSGKSLATLIHLKRVGTYT